LTAGQKTAPASPPLGKLWPRSISKPACPRNPPPPKPAPNPSIAP